MKDTIKMAREAGFESNGPIVVVRHSNGSWIGITKEIERLIAIVRADEQEATQSEWWMCVQSDLEHGVKCLNEQAADKWKKEYPQISKFGEWLSNRESK
jgi:hypothetical protein